MRKIFFLTIVLAALAFSGPQACAAKGDLNAQEAQTILHELIPNVKILHVKQSPMAGLWEVGIDMNGQKAIVYLDHAKKHIISPITRGEIYDIKAKTSLTQESLQKINKVDVSQIPLKDAIVMGDKTARNKIIVFSDVDWPYCVKLHQEMKKVITERKDIAFYTILFPLPMHKEAYGKSKAIVCEKSLEMLDAAYDKKPLPAPGCETTVIDENIKLAGKLGISGTPAVIFPDGVLIPGAMDAANIIRQIDKK